MNCKWRTHEKKSERQRLVIYWDMLCVATATNEHSIQAFHLARSGFSFSNSNWGRLRFMQNKYASITINFCFCCLLWGPVCLTLICFISFHFVPSFFLSFFTKSFFAAAVAGILFVLSFFSSMLSSVHDCGRFELHHLHLHLNCRFIGPSDWAMITVSHLKHDGKKNEWEGKRTHTCHKWYKNLIENVTLKVVASSFFLLARLVRSGIFFCFVSSSLNHTQPYLLNIVVLSSLQSYLHLHNYWHCLISLL